MTPTELWNNSSTLNDGVNVSSRESNLLTCISSLKNSTNRNSNVNNNNNCSVPKFVSDSNSVDVDKFVDSGEKSPEATSFKSILSSGSSDSGKSQKTKKAKIPDGGWGWVVVFSSFVISMIADGVSFSFGLLYIEFLNHFLESKSKTSWIGSLFMSVPLLSGPVMSALVDRYGCRKMTMLGGLVSGIGFVFSSFGDSIEFELIFFGFVAGVGLGLCYVTAVVSIAYWFDKYRTLAIGLGSCGTGVGTFVYAPLTQFLIEEYGWRGTVLILAGTFFNMCVCGAVMRDPEWWTLEQMKQSTLKSSKSGSIDESASFADGFPNKKNIQNMLKKGESPEYILTKLVTTIEQTTNFEENPANERGLPVTRSLLNLPTFMRQNEKVPLEVLEQLSNNKTVFNVFLENDQFLLHCRSISNDEKLNQLSKEYKPVPVTMSMKLKRSKKEDAFDFKDIPRDSSEEIGEKKLLRLDIIPNVTVIHGDRGSLERKPVMCGDTGQHYYLRGIRLHRNSVMYRGAMMNIPRYRLRASSCPNILRNSTTTIAKENEEKWYADALELFKAMFDFSMFLELHFLLMSLATILLFTWFIVPYFYLAEHLTRHGYTEVEGSFLLSIIGVTNCLGMVGLGWAGDQPWMSVTKTYAGCLIFCGVSCILMPLCTKNYNILAVVCALFGLFFASNYSFTPSILVQLTPLEKFTTAYGLTLLCQGIGNLVGPPLSGFIFDVTGEWDLSFYMAGTWIIISGFLIFLIQATKNLNDCGWKPTQYITACGKAVLLLLVVSFLYAPVFLGKNFVFAGCKELNGIPVLAYYDLAMIYMCFSSFVIQSRSYRPSKDWENYDV